MLSDLIIIEQGRQDRDYWRDIWRYRELFYVLAWRDLAIRYKQTVMGVAWALLRPFLTMLIFTVIFGRVAKLPSEGSAPYPLMVFAGMLPWTFFSTSLTEASTSLVNNSNMISKIYFPRLIVPTATVVVALADFLISFLLLIAMMIWYRFTPSWHMLALPAFVLLAVVASVGPGLWVTAMNVKYRDFRYVIPFVVQLGLYISPVGFGFNVISQRWRLLYSLNPVVGVINGFRWCILGHQSSLYLPDFSVSVAAAFLLLWIGIRHFRKTEKSFADLI